MQSVAEATKRFEEEQYSDACWYFYYLLLPCIELHHLGEREFSFLEQPLDYLVAQRWMTLESYFPASVWDDVRQLIHRLPTDRQSLKNDSDKFFTRGGDPRPFDEIRDCSWIFIQFILRPCLSLMEKKIKTEKDLQEIMEWAEVQGWLAAKSTKRGVIVSILKKFGINLNK